MRRPHEISVRDYFLLGLNPVVRFLIVSDVVIQGSAGLLAPIFALFVQDFINSDDTAAVAGVAAAIYLVTKSLLQIPAASLVDRIPGERDDYQILFWSSIVMGIVPITYLFIDTPIQLYIVQAILGATTAFSFPSYMAIFTRHIDRQKEGTEWGVYFTLTDMSAAFAAAVGGILAVTVGFRELIIGLAALNVLGTLLILPIARHMRMPKRVRASVRKA